MNYNQSKIHISNLNSYLSKSNCSDFRIEKFDGCKLYIVGSFDLCYYYEVKIIFHEVSEIIMNSYFNLDLMSTLFKIKKIDEQLINVYVFDDENKKQSIICEKVLVEIDTIKYLNSH